MLEAQDDADQAEHDLAMAIRRIEEIAKARPDLMQSNYGLFYADYIRISNLIHELNPDRRRAA